MLRIICTQCETCSQRKQMEQTKCSQRTPKTQHNKNYIYIVQHVPINNFLWENSFTFDIIRGLIQAVFTSLSRSLYGVLATSRGDAEVSCAAFSDVLLLLLKRTENKTKTWISLLNIIYRMYVLYEEEGLITLIATVMNVHVSSPVCSGT